MNRKLLFEIEQNDPQSDETTKHAGVVYIRKAQKNVTSDAPSTGAQNFIDSVLFGGGKRINATRFARQKHIVR